MTAPPTERMRGAAALRPVLIAVAPALLALGAALAFGVGHVSHESMRPGLEPGDAVVFDRVVPPARGDVVVVADPGGWSSVDGALLVKRVIAVGGDRVVCCEVGTGRLMLNGAALDESYVLDASRPGGVIPFDVRVADGSLWLVGDNRAASHDSRAEVSSPSGGTVPGDQVLGVVRATVPW
ncbi:signal peptidase I [Agromyces subbeticus]|uniref:signal peptidase I n=1 Tax=Agromyces subbeticus TaxID=293890 RepID=UPI000424A00D|nr:signal peptidase I [Agromyces subbeticus]